MKKILLNTLMGLVLIGAYGCNSNTTASNETIAESNAESGYGNDPNNNSDTTGAASASGQQTDTTSFAVMAASGGMMEVTLGNLAQQKGANADVKKFGQQMVTDHGKANAELKTIAASKNMMLPTAPLPKHQKHIVHLGSLSGAEFDKAYMDMMVNDHQEDVTLFQTTANDNNQEADLKAFAQKTLPVLKTHLQMAQQTQAKVK